MGIAASLLFLAAATAQAGTTGTPPSSAPASTNAGKGAAVQVHASARILAGAEVRHRRGEQGPEITSRTPPQIRRDSADRMWIEFS